MNYYFVNGKLKPAFAECSIESLFPDLDPVVKERVAFCAKPAEFRTAEDKKQMLPFFKSVAAFKDIGI